MPVEVASVKKLGRSLVVTIPKKILSELALRHGDKVAVRVAGEKLILQRIPLEEFSRYLAQAYAEGAR
jgi:antitoxin component of MazEF toxin-antitoxin module